MGVETTSSLQLLAQLNLSDAFAGLGGARFITGFTMLVLLTSAGGELELRTIRRRIGASKATATEVLDTLEARGFCTRARLESDRRAVGVTITPAGRNIVTHAFPAHAERVREAFGVLDEDEKRQLAALCHKLNQAA